MKIENINLKTLEYCLLKSLSENDLELGPLCKTLEFNNFETPLPSVKICLKELMAKNFICSKNSLYIITDLGKKYMNNLHSSLNNFFNNVINGDFNNPQLSNFSVIDVNEFNELFNGLSCLKFIPYSVHNFPNSDDDFFFTNTIFQRDELFYQFDGKRGLGKNHFKNTLALFFNSGSISFIGIIDYYDYSSKKIFFKPGSVLKLKKPIFEKNIQQIIPDFKFVRNFITFDNFNILTDIVALIKSNLEVIQKSEI